MKDVPVNNHTIHDYFEELVKEVDEHGTVMCSSQPATVGKWGMAKLWRMWMLTTAEFMARNGVTMPLMVNAEGVVYGTRPFSSDDAHELFTRQHLGADELNRRLSWAKSIKKENKDKERVATKGERFDALRKHEEWASNKGVVLFKPRTGEYFKLINKQDK